MTIWICATCGVEHADDQGDCAICADERQWMPADGQHWTTLEELAHTGGRRTQRDARRIEIRELEPDLLELTAEPKVGIGQSTFLVTTPAGSVLWDPVGFVDDAAIERIKQRGEVLAISSSHPHMFGVQLEWSRRLGDVPVLVSEPDLEWVSRTGPAIRTHPDRHEITPGLTLHRFGGHFPGSTVLHWEAGAEGRGVLLSSDTIHGNPDRATVTFLRSYPNRIPLSPAVVERITGAADQLAFDRLYDNFARGIDRDARAAVRRSADRYIAWARGDHDDLT
jgi:glyoxylase-like metal-dependent hydrolase (beta-lactamase superfamily II)